LAEPDVGQQDRFFILKKKDLQRICAKNYREWMDGINWLRPRNYKSLDNRYYIKNLLKYENNWNLVNKELNKT
jgi:hypothetical protein